MSRRLSISVAWLKRWRKDRKTGQPVPLSLPPEIWLRIISFLPPPEEWPKLKLYRVNRTFLDHYIRRTYRELVLFNPVPYLDGFAKTQYPDEYRTRRNLSVLRDPIRSEVVRTLKIRLKVQYYDYHREAADPENLEMALRSHLELLREGQEIARRPSLSEAPHIHLPRLNKLSLDLSKALGFRADPPRLLEKSLREHTYPFLATHAHLITTFSFSTPLDDPKIGDACFKNLPTFPALESLSIQVSSDRTSTWDGASRFLQQHSPKLKQLKIIISPRVVLSERRSRESIASSISSHNWTQPFFWAIPMPSLTEFQLFTDMIPAEGGPSLASQLPKSLNQLERLILSKPMSMPGDIGKLINHLETDGDIHQLKELFMTKAEVDHLGLRALARGFPQLRRLSIHSLDLKIDGLDASKLDEAIVRVARATSEWALEQFDFRHFPSPEGDAAKYRHAIAAALPGVHLFQGTDRFFWVEDIEII
ncbi:hypothetical protein NP233_g4455 [Leucocoprinus birnbaumii]|uniref:F-box domain-containing protein n=1 Tax=Leucocoprinus birnbaumii TaxID=56174 RepID=A0AAD5VX78_9AGAR|nr:hypothetical protein NP233_g4455 [Leucocoprinus birnbaumii]